METCMPPNDPFTIHYGNVLRTATSPPWPAWKLWSKDTLGKCCGCGFVRAGCTSDVAAVLSTIGSDASAAFTITAHLR